MAGGYSMRGGLQRVKMRGFVLKTIGNRLLAAVARLRGRYAGRSPRFPQCSRRFPGCNWRFLDCKTRFPGGRRRWRGCGWRLMECEPRFPECELRLTHCSPTLLASRAFCHVRVETPESLPARYALAMRRFRCGWRKDSFREWKRVVASARSRVPKLSCLPVVESWT